MANLTVDVPNVRYLEGIEARFIPIVADEAITKGQPVYRKANGRAGVARANAVGTAKVVGIAFKTTPVGGTFEALYHGRAVGYDLSATDPGTTVSLSASAVGAIDDAAVTGVGNVAAPLGTVHPMTDAAGTRFIFFDIPQNATPVAQ